MIFTNYSINYYNLLKVTISFLLIGIIAKSITKTPSVILEIFLLGSLLFFSLIYAAQEFQLKKTSTLILFVFLIYLFLHTLSATIVRPITSNLSFYDIFLFNILEFRLSTLSYFLPLVFIPLTKLNIDKFEKFLLFVLKISIAYTIFEQFLSMLGFRSFFEYFYYGSGIVTNNQIGVKSFGIYRIWGLVGSPQLLGVFHAMTLFYMVYKNEKNWAVLSFIAVLLSTSKTAYLIMIMIGPLYLFYKKQYGILLLTLTLITIISFISFNFYFYLVNNMSEAFPQYQKFIGSIIGYFTLIYHIEELSTPDRFIEGGPILTLINYFSNNPLEIFLGKGLSYSFSPEKTSAYDLSNHHYLTSDYYILTFFDQYGVFGTLLLIHIFFIYPLTILLKDGEILYFIPIIFFLSMFHYPPHIPKFMMIVASYPIFKLFLYEKR